MDVLEHRIGNALRIRLSDEVERVDGLSARDAMSAQRLMTDAWHRLQLLEQRVNLADPERLLKRGYSITTYKGRAVMDAGTLPDGAVVETRVGKGRFCSVVKKSMSANEKR